MISIRKSIDDLEGRSPANTVQSVQDCYTLAINSVAHYAVAVDPSLAAEFRSHLSTIEELAKAATSIVQLREVQSSLRGELREYNHKSGEQLKKLRRQVEVAASAMAVFADAVASSGGNHDQELAAQLRALETGAQAGTIEEIRIGISAAASGIRASAEQMQRENQLLVAQLRDEIQVLHDQIAEDRKALFTDRASGAWNRQKVDLHLDNLLRQNQPFCLLLVLVRNFKGIQSRYPPPVVDGSLKAVTERLAALTGKEAVIGRWSEDEFVAVLDVPPASAFPLAAEASRKLSGNYSVQENGLARTVAIHATAGIIDKPRGADSAAFHDKLQQLAKAIAGTLGHITIR